MVIKVLITFLGIEKLPEQAQRLVQRVVVSVVLLDLVWNLSSAFYVLFVIDTVGIAQLGILIAVSFLLQAILDYPSGVLGDWIGQRWILFIGFTFEAMSYSALVFADSFSTLLVVYCLRAIGFSQQSGAISTWLENNYKLAANKSDPQRTTYKFFMGRWMTLLYIIPGISIAIGGVLATMYFRRGVFFIQVIGLFFIAILYLVIVKDFPEIERPKRSFRSYFRLLSEGFRFVLFDRVMLLYMIGLCISETTVIIWVEMMLFPVYYGYTGVDSGVGFLRFVVLIVGTITAFYAAKLAAKMEIHWIPRLRFADTALFFWGVGILTFIFPIDKNTFTPFAIFLLITLYSSIMFFHNIAMILRQRFFLDLIPDKNRNSIYSLIPTLLLIVSAPVAVIGAWLIENLGVSLTAFILGSIGASSVFFYYFSLKSYRLISEKQIISNEN